MVFSILDIPVNAWGQGGFFVLLFIIIGSIITGVGGMFWICVSALRWFGREILVPLYNRVIKYIDTIEDEIKGISTEIKSSCKFDPSQHGCKHKSDNN